MTRSADSWAQARRLEGYVLAPLARTRHQPELKSFDLEVLESAVPGASLACGLHSFLYHFGSEPVTLQWGAQRRTLRPGDSAYVAPLVEHRLAVLPGAVRDAAANGGACGVGRRLLVVRIPGQLSGETLREFATFSAKGRERVGAETAPWHGVSGGVVVGFWKVLAGFGAICTCSDPRRSLEAAFVGYFAWSVTVGIRFRGHRGALVQLSAPGLRLKLAWAPFGASKRGRRPRATPTSIAAPRPPTAVKARPTPPPQRCARPMRKALHFSWSGCRAFCGRPLLHLKTLD